MVITFIVPPFPIINWIEMVKNWTALEITPNCITRIDDSTKDREDEGALCINGLLSCCIQEDYELIMKILLNMF
ncbi:979_t:CDS:2 [Dentiscutata heterogama]|uniref:979_t:CDS:1 n=1 Tax=Dentiscutata heterogama TaxID=1316150 RepID=A0ACA9KAF4_9GLOM|nr:979_t:CDS:2 [Dentiscutata heterogama]